MVKLIEPLLDGRQKLHPLSDILERRFIWQLADCIEHEFLLCHVANVDFAADESKRALRECDKCDELHAEAQSISGLCSFSRSDRALPRAMSDLLGFADII